jgi:hypothetical protein
MGYSEEQVKLMKEMYLDANTEEERDEVVLELAELLDKPKKSIISKLNIEKVYIKKEYKTKTGDKPITKKEMIFNLALLLKIDPEKIQGVEKTPKLELKFLIESIENELNRTAKTISPQDNWLKQG